MSESSSVRSFEAFIAPQNEVAEVLAKGLKEYFEEVDVKLVDTPNFSEYPFKLAIKGLNGKPAIADVGGVHNLIPKVNLDSKFSLEHVVKPVFGNDESPLVSIFGPGGGSFGTLGFCCEFMGSATYCIHDDKNLKLTNCACRYAYVDDEGAGHWLDQEGSDKFGLMGNFYMSQDKPGKVIKVLVRKRLSKLNYTESIRSVLLAHYGQDKPISMGGVFLINKGSAKLHIMPKYWPKEPSTDQSVNNEWLKYYNIKKNPLVCLSVFHSADPGYNLRMEHTHCYNLDDESEAGHYHYDTTPNEIEYEGYFNLAEKVYRIV